MREVTLGNIFVGDPDGLAEARKDKFGEYFYKKNKKYEELRRNQGKFIVTGRKGTGKTLLAKYYEMQSQKDGILIEYIDKDKVLFRQLQSIGNGDIPQRERGVFIHYAIIREIWALVLKNKKQILQKQTFLKRIRLKKAMREFSKMLDGDDIFNFEKVGIKRSEENVLSSKFTIHKSEGLSQIKQNMEDAYVKSSYYNKIDELQDKLLEIVGDTRISLIIDDLDEYDERIAVNSSFSKFLSKFIEVTYKFNLALQEKSKESKIILLFRSDLFRFLHNDSTNLNKYVVNSQVNLNWLKDGNTSVPENHILMDMIFNKIRTSISELQDYTNKELFEQFFPVKIKGRETLRYMLNFSHGRPRDIVNLLNKIIAKYPNEKKFTNDMFLEVEAEYSKDFCNELRNEMSLYYGSEYINACFNMISLIRKRNFSLQEAEYVLRRNKQLSVIDDLDKALEILYQYGAIGNMKSINSKEHKFYFGYREDGSETLNYTEKFTVHFALRTALL